MILTTTYFVCLIVSLSEALAWSPYHLFTSSHGQSVNRRRLHIDDRAVLTRRSAEPVVRWPGEDGGSNPASSPIFWS